MTSETSRAVEVLRLVVSEYKAKCCRNKGEDCEVCRSAEAAITTLQQREAGAVAWTYRDLDDPSRVIARTANEFGGNIDLYPDKWKRERPLIYGDTPAQPASQQAHPTGDRVRGLVSELRESITDYGDHGENLRNEVLADLLTQVDRIAAALDQEKNDGR